MLNLLPQLTYFLRDGVTKNIYSDFIKYDEHESSLAMPKAVIYMDQFEGYFETPETISVYNKKCNTGKLVSVGSLIIGRKAKVEYFPNIENVTGNVVIHSNHYLKGIGSITHCKQIICSHTVRLNIEDNWSEMNSNYPYKYIIDGVVVNCKRAISNDYL